jgi:photosystem I P700 chlorophyll a apoprotein A2
MGWLRDYLWLNSSQLINGYNPFGMNSLSVWAWMFLFGHLIYATGFMFLILGVVTGKSLLNRWGS